MAELSAEQMQKMGETFLAHLPHAKALGIRLVSIAPARVEMAMPWAEHLVGDPETGVIHGGAVSALMDTCGGAAVLSHPQCGAHTATIDLRIDYMRAATPGQVVRAVAECYHVTRSVAFVRATALDDDAERPVAAATAAFTFEKRGA